MRGPWLLNGVLAAKGEDFGAVGTPCTQMVPPVRDWRLLLFGALRAPVKLNRPINSPLAAKQNISIL